MNEQETGKIKMRKITVVEYLITYISVGWSVVMLTQPSAFNQSLNFQKLSSIVGSEWVVGITCLIIAIVKIIGMAIRNARVRWIGLILSTLFWIIVSATFLLSGDEFMLNTGFIVYSGLAVMCLFTSKEVMQYDRTD